MPLKRVIFAILSLLGATLLAPTWSEAQTCDQSLWKHVYNSQRLKVIKACWSATGTKQDATAGKRSNGCRREADGDDHCFAKLDDPSVLNDENKSKQGGNLVYEPMCQHKVTQKDAMKACKNWSQQIAVAEVGQRIRLTGALVLDTQHGHIECHPCSIAVLK